MSCLVLIIVTTNVLLSVSQNQLCVCVHTIYHTLNSAQLFVRMFLSDISNFTRIRA